LVTRPPGGVPQTARGGRRIKFSVGDFPADSGDPEVEELDHEAAQPSLGDQHDIAGLEVVSSFFRR